MDPEVDELARISLFEERLSVLRHDLRNRLGSIRNGAFYLRRRSEKSELWEEDARFPKFFGLIEKELEAAETLLAEQASTAELVVRRLESQMLAAGVQRGLEALCVPPGVHLVSEFAQSAEKPFWVVEIALLTRCLAANALEAMDGSVGAGLRVRTGSEGDRAWLRVEDTGPGIAPEAMSGALQPFRSQKPGHLGIGLNVVRRIVQRYQGQMRLQRAECGGLAVEIGFP